jgi:hypothetical protein
MADDWRWEQYHAELKQMTERSSANLAEAANGANVRRMVRGFTKQMRGQPRADIAAALIATVAEFIQRCGCDTPGQMLTLTNTMLQEIANTICRPPPN